MKHVVDKHMCIALQHRDVVETAHAAARRLRCLLPEVAGEITVGRRSAVELDAVGGRLSKGINVEADERRQAPGVGQVSLLKWPRPLFLPGGIPVLPASLIKQASINGSPDIKVGRSPGRSDQELCDLGRNRLIHGFFWDLPEQYFLASVDGRLRRPRSGWGACSAAAKSRRKVFNLWLLLDDRWAGDTAQVEPVR